MSTPKVSFGHDVVMSSPSVQNKAGKAGVVTDGAKLHLLHATGIHSPIRSNIEAVSTTEEESGRTQEYVLYPVGQHAALYRMEDGRMKFLTRKSALVREVLAMCVSPNKKVCAVSERRVARPGEPGVAQISLFHMLSQVRVRGLQAQGKAPFTSLCFSGDSKLLVSVSGEPDFQLVIWQWDKEVMQATASLNAQVTRVCCNPSQTFQITTSGVAHMRLWTVGADNEAKVYPLLTQSREQELFVDHTWVRGSTKRMIALAEAHEGRGAGMFQSLIPATMTLSAAGAPVTVIRTATIYVFESIDSPPYLEIKQAIQVGLLGTTRLETVVAHGKGFLVGGSNGYFSVFEKTDDRKDPFILIKSLRCGEETIKSLALSTNKEVVFAVTKSERLLSFNLSAVDTLDEGALAPFTDMTKGGFHIGSVTAVDVCRHRPIVITAGSDKTIRVWNYLKGRCDVLHHTKIEEATAIACHPTGFQLLAAFKERVRVYNTLLDDLRCVKELSLKHCRELRYSEGGHMFACALGITVAVYSSVTFQQLATFTGHIGIVRCLAFSKSDRVLYSTGADGNVFAWDLVTWTKLDEPTGLDSSCPNTGLVVHLASSQEEPHRMAICGNDGYLRQITWIDNVRDQTRTIEYPVGEAGVNLTVLVLSPANKCMFAGMDTGNVRAYEWPLTGNYVEYPCHTSAVTGLRVTCNESRLVSTGDDGSVMMFGVQRVENGVDLPFVLEAEGAVNAEMLNGEFFLVAQEELADRQQEFKELKKQYDDLKSDSDYNLKRKDAEWTEELKIAQEEAKRALQAERTRFEELQAKYEQLILEHMQDVERKDNVHSEMLRELEDQYEHKLAVEMERYDKLSEEIELIKEQCNTKLDDQREQSEAALRDFEVRATRVEQQLRHQIERLIEEAKFNDTTYKEVLEQQEVEYEAELRELIAAAENEISGERDNTSKVRAVAQNKHTKLDQLKKKVIGIEQAALQREKLLENEKAKNSRLEATMQHLERHLEERNKSLEEKERTIVELRNNNRTLENFRYVLDHRLKQLMEERGPVTKHIEDLEGHIRAMYDDLVDEFQKKKESTQVNQTKDMKLSTLQSEVVNLRTFLRQKERYIATFKQDLSNNVLLTMPKDIEEAMKDMYRKYVRREGSRNGRKGKLSIEAALQRAGVSVANAQAAEAAAGGDGKEGGQEAPRSDTVAFNMLVEGLQEANRQRTFMEKRNEDLNRKVDTAKKGAYKEKSRAVVENAELIGQCNDLRKANFELRRETARLKTLLLEAQQHHAALRDGTMSMADGHDDHSEAPSEVDPKLLTTQSLNNTRAVEPIARPEASTEKGASGAVKKSHSLRSSSWLSAAASDAAGVRPGSGYVQKGSTRELNALAAREAEVVSLTRQLDSNLREIEMHKLDIANLRKALSEALTQLKQSHSKGHKNKKRPSLGTAQQPSPQEEHHSEHHIAKSVRQAQPTAGPAVEEDGPGIIKRASLQPRPQR